VITIPKADLAMTGAVTRIMKKILPQSLSKPSLLALLRCVCPPHPVLEEGEQLPTIQIAMRMGTSGAVMLPLVVKAMLLLLGIGDVLV
tara:strand:+ start:13 stop:276 length:264 start_codon:yes stop_codon:yes gene_type:complete